MITEWRRRIHPAMPQARLSLLRNGWQFKRHEVSIIMRSSDRHVAHTSQRLFTKDIAGFCARKSSDRNHSISSAGKAPGHQRPVHERTRKGHLRAESRNESSAREGDTAEERKWREAEAGHEASKEFERECQRHLGSIPRAEVQDITDLQLYTFALQA